MLVSRAGLSPVMVGRDLELAQLRRLATDASKPTIALIGGEPGIGKTRLASELINAMSPGTTVLVGQAEPGALGQPYQLVRDLAGGRAAPTSPFPQPDPFRDTRAGLDHLRALVGAGPALLVVDDLHWADPESLAMFEQLDEVTTGPLLLVGTYRPDELTRRHPLAGALERLERRRGVTHLRLAPLTIADTSGFLTAVYGRAPSHRVVKALHKRTGGNPFFLEELLKAAGDTPVEKIHTQPLPWNLAEALRSQLDGLATEQRQVIEAAAVLGARAPFDLLATMTGMGEPALIAALRTLVERGLLVESEDDQFGFRHALAREVVAGEMLGRQRRRLHEVALDTLLAGDSPDLAAVAVHARGAGRFSDMVKAARQGAAERLAAGSPYTALTLAELGLEESPEDVALLTTAATAAWRAGYPADAERHARSLAATADDAGRAVALNLLMRVACERHDPPTMERWIEQLRQLAERVPTGEVQTRAMAAIAQSYMFQGRHADAVAWADRACAAAERMGLKEVRLSALVEKGSTLIKQDGTHAEGRRLLAEVAAEAEQTGAYVEAARACHNLFWYLPPAEAAEFDLLDRMRRNAERAGLAGIAGDAYHRGRAWAARATGDLDRAVTVLEEALRSHRRWAPMDWGSGDPMPLDLWPAKRADLRGQLIQLYLERGDLAQAEAALAEIPPAERDEAVAGLAFQLACRRGDLPAARRLLRELTGRLDGVRLPSAELLHQALAAGLATGLPAELLRPLAERPTGYKDSVDPPDRPLRVLLTAQLAEAEGRYESAAGGYAQTTGSDDPHVWPAIRGSAAVGAARCLALLGRADGARAHIAVAERYLARWCGWRQAELATLSRRLAGAAAGGESGLTPREREVAALLAEGLTNSDIAQRLVISRKTVAVHVSHILAKLEMTSRTQVAAWVAREGLPLA